MTLTHILLSNGTWVALDPPYTPATPLRPMRAAGGAR